MLRRILVPLDGSSFGEHALPHALALARRFEATVDLAHVHEPAPVIYMEGVPQLDASLELDGIEHDRHYLEGVRERVAQQGPTVESTLLDGPTVPALLDHSDRSGADLIVMTTHGRGPLTRAWLGSVADGLARQAQAPLLLIRPPEPEDERSDNRPDLTEVPPSLRRVAIPLDGSPESETIVAPALQLLEPEDGQVTFVHVVPPTLVIGGHVFHLSEERQGELREAARQRLGDVIERCQADARLELRVAHEPAAAILDAAEATGADFIAMATRARGGLSRLLFGSVTDKVLRAATLPLLIARPDRAE